MFILKTSLSLLLFFVFIIYFTIRKVNPLCEKIIYTRKKVGGRPTSPAESRVSLSGCILSHHQVTRFGISDSHGFARRKAPSKPVPCLSQGTLVGQEAAHSPRATNHEPQKSTSLSQCFFYKNQRLPILPGGLPPSTFGVCGLNCCVRHGNRWIPAAIATELLGCSGFVS